jgi:prepilin-type N-terminal cleavage/methylation domain-containing protein
MMIRQRTASTSEAGFTLAEMLVSLAVTALLLLAVLFTFDFSSRIARAQSHLSDLQQSLRIAQDDMVRLVRMAGRGSLPQSLALTVRDKVPNNQFMLGTDEATRILPGTDVLTVRGIFGPIYNVSFAGSASFDNPTSPTSGTLTILDVSPGGAQQDLTPLKSVITAGIPEAILLASALDDSVQAVVELDPGASSIAANQVVIAFRISGGTRTDRYIQLSTGGAFQKAVENVAFAGILEEHRYYVREVHAVPGDQTTDLAPKLARARFYPGTDDPYQSIDDNARVDLADSIIDLQVAFAFDTTNGGTGFPLLETANGVDDDWLFNNSADNPSNAVWAGPPEAAIQYVRITTLARSDRRDPQYQAPLLPSQLEDRAYTAADPLNSYASRMYRWQTLRTMIDLRNL